MGSDQILGLTMVTSNGSVLRIHSTHNPVDENENITCFRDGTPMTNEHCGDIWFAMRGAGSSFGLVTTLTGGSISTYLHAYVFMNNTYFFYINKFILVNN